MRSRGAFESLDQTYLDDLVTRAGAGNSDAFAELFVAVSDRQLSYLTYLIGNRAEAAAALEDVMVAALRGMRSIARPSLFMLWLSRLSTNAYLEMPTSKDMDTALLARLLSLPLAESQIMIMSTIQGMSVRDIGAVLNIGTGTVKKFIKIGRRHLSGAVPVSTSRGAAKGTDTLRHKTPSRTAVISHDALSPVETAVILKRAFEACGMEPNTVPVSALYSYAIYRKERFGLQRRVIAALLVTFALLPALFITPDYTVTSVDTGERGLPVYTVRVNTMLPVGRVTAAVRDHSLPVYEAGANEFTVEPTRNGDLTLRIELVNRQSASATEAVTAVDSDSPRLTGSETFDDTFRLDVTDDGIGVDYREIYAVDASGRLHRPLSAGGGSVTFEYPDEAWDVYIPDHIGNTLHLSVKLK